MIHNKKKALLQKDGRCLVCERRCFIKDGKRGHCKTRVNEHGIIYTLNYGNISSLSVNPIEKKPLFHFFPGTTALTVGFWSCNFNCPWCQNHDISKTVPQFNEYLSPDDFINFARTQRCEGISLSLNEPTVFPEWGIEAIQKAKQEGLYTTIVSNGYMTDRTLKLMIDAGLDAVNIDIKGDTQAVKKYCGADVEYVWRNCTLLKKRNIHIEITTLVIPTVNDTTHTLSEIAQKISHEFGDATPWHLTRYFPAYQFSEPATLIPILETAYATAKQNNLKFVYVGNVPNHTYENTYCPFCGQLLIERTGLAIIDMQIDKKCLCPHCKHDLKNYFVL
jgi:pyruvate formate lyase activating enzyme